MKTFLRFASVSTLAIGMAACSAPPTPFTPDDHPLPGAFQQTAMVEADAPVWPQTGWWTNFGSDELTSLQQTAQANNLDIAAAIARVIQAQAAAGTAFAPLLPNISASGGITRAGQESTGAAANSSRFGGSASYEIDFWGKNRNALYAARYNAKSSRYAAGTTALTVSANVANTYFQVLALRERIAITRQNVEASERILAITQAKVTNGVSSNLDLAQQQAQVAGQQARIPALEEQEREARHTLALLLGRPVEGFDITGNSVENLKAPTIQPGTPTELLTRRPDLAQAEANLLAAHANLDAARAAFFPSITLAASGTFSAAGILDGLFNPASFGWSIGSALAQSIFDGGRLHYQSESALARQQELLATYRSTVYAALNDVENAMGQYKSNTDQAGFTATQQSAAAEAFRISELRYREGVTDVLSVLQTQQTLFSAQDSLIQIKLGRLQASVSLYRAMGGGWTKADSDTNVTDYVGWSPL